MDTAHLLLLQVAEEAKIVPIKIQVQLDIMDKQQHINHQIIIQHIQLLQRQVHQVQLQVVQWEFHSL